MARKAGSKPGSKNDRRERSKRTTPKGGGGAGGGTGGGTGGGGTPWNSQHYQLPEKHTWKSSEGYAIFVANRGDVRFEFPGDWTTSQAKDAIRLHDVDPPAEECRVSVTVFNLPQQQGRSWLDEPLVPMLQGACRDTGEKDGRPLGEVTGGRRLNYEWAWGQSGWLDRDTPPHDRWIVARHLMARTARIHVLITFEYYEDRPDFAREFDHLLKTLRLAEPVTLGGPPRLN